MVFYPDFDIILQQVKTNFLNITITEDTLYYKVNFQEVISS